MLNSPPRFCLSLRWISKLSQMIRNKTVNVCKVQHCGAFVQPLLKWKSNNITPSECVFVTLRVQHAISVPGCKIFSHVIS